MAELKKANKKVEFEPLLKPDVLLAFPKLSSEIGRLNAKYNEARSNMVLAKRMLDSELEPSVEKQYMRLLSDNKTIAVRCVAEFRDVLKQMTQTLGAIEKELNA